MNRFVQIRSQSSRTADVVGSVQENVLSDPFETTGMTSIFQTLSYILIAYQKLFAKNFGDACRDRCVLYLVSTSEPKRRKPDR